ncbi:gamma-glutamyltransferase [Gemmatimonadota bacterium]
MPAVPSRLRLFCAALLALVLFGCFGTSVTPPSASPEARFTARSSMGMVVSANSIASQVGADVLKAGGNAVDAAIATGFALAVVHPSAGNIGGGGFMVIRYPDRLPYRDPAITATAIDFREKAPLAAHPEMFLDENGEYSSDVHHNSHLAVGVPGTVAGFALAHQEHGNLPWSDLVAPAECLAEDGFVLSPALARTFGRMLPRFADYPATLAQFSKDGEPYEAGETFTQPDLAKTLKRIRQFGRDGFYKGQTAFLIAQEMRRGGGAITEEDLARYRPVVRTPIRGTYNGYDIISMPPPSSGGVALVQMLNILEGFDLQKGGHNSATYIHLVTESMRRTFRDRARFLADPDFRDVPVERLTSKTYAAELRREIDQDRATPSSPTDVARVMLYEESPQTTHFSVVDADGMAVSVTYTLEAGYGSKIVVPGGGFLLNNEMGDFNAVPKLTTITGLIGTEPNLARPEQRMLSSMTPTILAKDGKLVAVVGSPGGRTIINTVLQVVLNVTEFDMGIQEAVNAKRFHHQWLPDQIRVEQDAWALGAGVGVEGALTSMGHSVRVMGTQGSVHAIMIDPKTGERLGAPDLRDPDSGAVGY